jgi:hypothetical protein
MGGPAKHKPTPHPDLLAENVTTNPQTIINTTTKHNASYKPLVVVEIRGG